jgi:hypothetical protein
MDTPQRHVIEHTETGAFKIKHPPGCDLMDCNFYSAYTSTILEPSDKGRFWCTLDTNGDFVQQEAVEDWWCEP